MKPFWMCITCLAALLAGAAIGRQTIVVGSGQSKTEVHHGRPGNAVTTAIPQDLPTAVKTAASQRGKMLVMLNVLEGGSSRSMEQLVDAISGDHHQLAMLADLALHTDPGGFLQALIHSKPDEETVGYMASDFAERWGKLDFPAALESCLNFPQPLSGGLAGAVLETNFANDPTVALKFAVAHPALRFGWSNELDIPATPENLDLIRRLPPSMDKAEMIRAVSKNLGPDEAFALVLEDRSFDPVYGGHRCGLGLLEKDPGAARDWILEHPSHPAASLFSYQYGYHLLKNEPAAAAEWAASQLSGQRRTSILERAAKALESKNPAAAEAVRAWLPSAIKSVSKP